MNNPKGLKDQRGVSLIEFMIAGTISVIALGIVGSVVVTGQKTALQRTNELALLQSTNSVLQMMKMDMQRAGYDGVQGKTIKLSGADNVFYAKNGPDFGLIAYAYASEMSGAVVSIYTNVVYEQQSTASNVLRICEKKQDTVMSIADAEDFTTYIGHNCNTLFHTARIKVDKFNVSLVELPGSKVSSAIVTVDLQTSLENSPSLTKSLSFTTKQRNW